MFGLLTTAFRHSCLVTLTPCLNRCTTSLGPTFTGLALWLGPETPVNKYARYLGVSIRFIDSIRVLRYTVREQQLVDGHNGPVAVQLSCKLKLRRVRAIKSRRWKVLKPNMVRVDALRVYIVPKYI